MADRHIAFLFVMSHEDAKLSGVVVTDNDGGQVRFGVNSRSNPQAVTDGFYTMSKDAALAYAENIFTAKYWNPISGDEVKDQRVSNQFSDLYFNAEKEAVLIIQRAVNRFLDTPIGVDGQMGPLTLGAINDCCVVIPEAATLLDAIKGQAIVFYQTLVKIDPVKYNLQVYRSWMSRLNA